jgi:surfeit locus 1 family protein
MFELQEKQTMPPTTQGLNLLRQNIDMKSFSDETGLRFLANALQTGEPSEGLLRDWPTSLSGSDKNRAYALQWFALACVCIGLFAWFQIIQKIKHD